MDRSARMKDVFNPDYFNSIVQIGAGATGSHFTDLIVRAGINPSRLLVYDDDVVENHNLGNQIYTANQIDKLKVDALMDSMLRITHEGILCIRPERIYRIKGQQELVVFSTDSNDANKRILSTLKSNHVVMGRINNWGFEVNYIPSYGIKKFGEMLPTSSDAKIHQLESTCHVRQDMNFIAQMCACAMFQRVLLISMGLTPPATLIVDFRNTMEVIEAMEEAWSKE
jgi:hypothetical protein